MLLNGAVVAVQENWVTLVDQDESAVLEWVSCVNETKLVLHYLHDVKVKIQTQGAALKCSLTLPRDYGVVIQLFYMNICRVSHLEMSPTGSMWA